jgi:hypothetical protein
VSAVSAPYHPGQSPWPDNQSQRPDRPPPIQFHNEEQEPRGSGPLTWALRIAGLVAVAVISGFVWFYIQSEGSGGDATGPGGEETQQQSTGEYEFTEELDSPKVDNTCGDHAYDATQTFLQEKDCSKLTRSVFTTTVNGRTVYASVAVVEMDDEEAAGDLRELTDTDGSGNVNDLVREGEVTVEGLETLSNGGGYASEQRGTQVTIVEADYDPTAKDGGSPEELKDVCKDAIRLGGDITGTPPRN